VKVLVGCEESGIVTKAFRKRGHDAYSCDLLPTRGNDDWHIQGDVNNVIASQRWDLIVLHPPCTALSLSGNRWYGKGMPRHNERLLAIEWTLDLWMRARLYADKVALENPASVIFPKLITTVQWLHPWQFGHGEVKKTGLALHNLEDLIPTEIVEGREPIVWKMAPSETRARDRSITYKGIADAMAEQWG